MGNDLDAQKVYADYLHQIKLKRERAGLQNSDVNYVEQNVEMAEFFKAEQKRK